MRILVATCAGVSPEAGIAGIPLTKIAGHFALPLFAGSVASQTDGITEVAPAPLPEPPLYTSPMLMSCSMISLTGTAPSEIASVFSSSNACSS